MNNLSANLSETFEAVSNCRVCSGPFLKSPLLQYQNMPKAAQYLPDIESIKEDKGVTLRVCQCSCCGLVQLDSAPVSYYREVIRAAAVSSEMAEFRRKQFGAFVEAQSLRGRKILEIGCGGGEYLSILEKSGVDAYGVEYSPSAVERCVNNGLKVTTGFVDGPGAIVKGGPFDAFLILNFLEHLPDQCATLRGIFNNLTADGIGLIEVPNFDMIVRKKLFSEFTADHLFYFTRNTLTTTLSRNGFDILECSEEWHGYILSAIVRKRSRLDLSELQDCQTHLIAELSEYVHRFNDKRVAIWGAGHQAFALMSMMDVTQRIRYVVDSAPFKQGKFTPATHLPIVAPSTLESDPVDAVIVMAASYSDEVAGIVREEFGRRMDVVILRDYGLETVTSLPDEHDG